MMFITVCHILIRCHASSRNPIKRSKFCRSGWGQGSCILMESQVTSVMYVSWIMLQVIRVDTGSSLALKCPGQSSAQL